jgi:hypothetical protein
LKHALVLYPEPLGKRARQTVSDVVLLAWLGACTWLAVKVHAAVAKLATTGDTIHDTGQHLADNLTTIQNDLNHVPLLGGSAHGPLDHAGAAARSLAAAGQTEHRLAGNLAILAAVRGPHRPVAFVVLRWLPRRVQWVNQATAAARLREQPAGIDLLALRALANQPLRRLTPLDPDPAAAWRHGQPAAIHTLAGLELHRVGLRPPAMIATAPRHQCRPQRRRLLRSGSFPSRGLDRIRSSDPAEPLCRP